MSTHFISKRWAAIWLRRLSTDRLKRSNCAFDPQKSFATYHRIGSAFLIDAVDDAAAKLGIASGMPLADARGCQPSLQVVEADPAADAELMRHVADFCERWTPCIAFDAPDGLLLEIAGSSHLFSGEEGLRAHIERRIAKKGFAVRVAIADTPGAAWAIAHFSKEFIAEPGKTQTALSPLPISALRLSAGSEALLRRLGLKTVGDILQRARSPFAARIGEEAICKLDEATGTAQPAITFHRPAPDVFAVRNFVEPVTDADSLFIGISDAARDIAMQAEKRQIGVLRLGLTIFSLSREVHQISIGFSQGEREADRLAQPFRDHLQSGLQLFGVDFGVEILRLDAVQTAPFNPDANHAAAHLIDTLSARLGAGSVQRIACADRYIPEHAQIKSAAIDSKLRQTLPPCKALRPLKLLSRPEPIEAIARVPDGPPREFRWRRVLRAVKDAEGPERISPEWWTGDGVHTRDYFQIEDEKGTRYWVFREGLYNREAEKPRWFIHGLFG